MAIKFFCDRCDKEIWQGLATREDQVEAILYEDCVCSDCMLDEAQRKRSDKEIK